MRLFRKNREAKAQERAERAREAARDGDLAALRALVAQQPDVVHSADLWESTPLHWAAAKGHAAAVEFLLEHDAHVDAVNKYGNTPLHSAAYNGELAIVQLLLRNGAHREATDQNGWTPLYHAVNNGRRDTAVYLVRTGASLDVYPTNGSVPLRERLPRAGLEQALLRAEEEWQREHARQASDQQAAGKHATHV